MREAKAFELDGSWEQAPIHIVHIAQSFRRPEAFGDGCRSWPDARVKGARIEVFSPHADFAAEDQLAFARSEIRRSRNRIGQVMPTRRPHGIEVVRSGKDAFVAQLRAVGERSLAAP